MYLFRYFGISVVAMCNLLSTEDNYRPAFIIIDRKQFSHIFCYTFVNYSKRSMKHADLQSIFTITLPIKKTAIRRTITLKKKITRPYPGIAPGGYSIHCTNTNPNPYPGANPG